MHIEIKGLDKLEQKLNNLVNPEKMRNNVEQACLIVEAAAKEKTPVQTGELRRSIQTDVNFYGNITEGHVFSNLEYAPYVEYGTGLFAENGGGRKGWWIYVDGYSSGGSSSNSKQYATLDEAKRAMAIMLSNHPELAGQVHITQGQHPHPFLRPALIENKEKVKQKILEGVIND